MIVRLTTEFGDARTHNSIRARLNRPLHNKPRNACVNDMASINGGLLFDK